ncbi:MAG: hypothetical protein M3R08_01120 [Bacteroidota bacterium]|nr:hypothetical protein [Bacteroidota bacterium]
MFRSFVLLVLLLIAIDQTQAQRLMDRKRPELIPGEGKVRRGGFYIAPGVTYLLPRDPEAEQEIYRNSDTIYSASYDPHGKLGLYVEAGWFHATRDPVILDYWDVGLAYKNFRGRESAMGIFQRGELADSIYSEGDFAERYLTLHLNANKFIQIRDYQFFQMTLGANADYRLGSDYAHTAHPILNRHVFPPDLIGQLHFKLGFGFKLTGSLLLIPSVETPIFSIVPEDQGKWGQLDWFSSTYRPLIFSLRFLWLRAPKGFECPAPIREPGERGKGKHKHYKPEDYHP